MSERSDRIPLVLAASMAFVTVAIGVATWLTGPDATSRGWDGIVLGPLVWGFMEGVAFTRRKTPRATQEHRTFRLIAATVLFFVGFEAAVDLASVTGVVRADGITGLLRLRGVLVGVAIAAWGNVLPKFMSPWSVEEEPFDWQRVRRFQGVVAVLGGVLVAFAWIALDADRAEILTAVAAFAVLGLMTASKIVSRVKVALRRRSEAPR